MILLCWTNVSSNEVFLNSMSWKDFTDYCLIIFSINENVILFADNAILIKKIEENRKSQTNKYCSIIRIL